MSEEKLFELIENDLKQIYDPSSKRELNFSKRIKKKVQSFLELIIGNKRFKRKNGNSRYEDIFEVHVSINFFILSNL